MNGMTDLEFLALARVYIIRSRLRVCHADERQLPQISQMTQIKFDHGLNGLSGAMRSVGRTKKT